MKFCSILPRYFSKKINEIVMREIATTLADRGIVEFQSKPSG